MVSSRPYLWLLVGLSAVPFLLVTFYKGDILSFHLQSLNNYQLPPSTSSPLVWQSHASALACVLPRHCCSLGIEAASLAAEQFLCKAICPTIDSVSGAVYLSFDCAHFFLPWEQWWLIDSDTRLWNCSSGFEFSNLPSLQWTASP